MTTFAVRGAELPAAADLGDLLPGRDELIQELTDQLPFCSVQAVTLVLLGIARTGPVAPPTVLSTAGGLIAGSLRGDDWLGRIGPDEFAVVLAVPVDDAHSVAARVLDGIAATGLPGLTGAAGLAELSADLTPAEALGRATASLDLARSLPRDRIVRHLSHR